MPLCKYVGNIILSQFQNFFLGAKLSEYHSGYRAYSVHALKKLPFLKNSNDFHFDTEIIIQLMEAGLRIKEVPIPTYYGDEICHVNGISYAWNVGKAIILYRLHKAQFLFAPQFDVKEGSKRYTYKRNRFSSHNRIIDMIQGSGITGLDVLDLGCGAGFLAGRIALLGHRVVGVDVYESEEARHHCDQFIVTDIEEDFGLVADQEFDLIIFADSLEHARNPEAILTRAKKHLKPNGRIIASTGNIAHFYTRFSLLLGHFTYTERGLLDRTHYRLFTLASFKNLFKGCSFKVCKTKLCPIPFEQLFPDKPRLVNVLTSLYMVAVRIWPSLFAYQVVLEAEPIEDPIEQLREREIKNTNYEQWKLPISMTDR
jgi:SAM-dependent methyltransferase